MAAGTDRGATPPRERGPARRSATESGSDEARSKAADASAELREILITVSPSQFEAFARDLRLLRARGAESNTQAIIEAVRDRAATARVRAVDEREAA